MNTPTLKLVRRADYGQEIQGFIFPIRVVTSNAETLDEAIEQSNQAEQLVRAWNSHDALVALLRETSATLKMWADVAPAVSLIKDIDAALAAAGAA